MKKIDLTLKYLRPPDQYEDVPHTGYTSETPGLAVCRRLQWGCDNYHNGEGDWHYKPADNWWQVIHIESGLPIGSKVPLARRKDALAAAKTLGEFADWTMPASELCKLPRPVLDAIYAVFEKYK